MSYGEIHLEEKYVRNGWPSLNRPDLIAPKGWSISLISAVNRIRNHSLSPDGKSIAFIWDREELSDIYCLSSNGGWPVRITTDRPAFQYWWDEIPRWSPDGQWLAFCVHGVVHVSPVSGGLPVKISDFSERAFSPMWMPDSQGVLVCVHRNEVDQLLLTDRTGKWPQAVYTGPGDASDAHPSPDGSKIVFVERPLNDLNRLNVVVYNLINGEQRLLSGDPGEKDWSPRWSPDGRHIAYLSQRSGFAEVWLYDLELGKKRQLTHAGKDLVDLAWSPDGSYLAAVINRGGAFDLVLIDSGSGTLIDLVKGKGVIMRPNWAPDGRFLTLEYTDPKLPPDIYRIDLFIEDEDQPSIQKTTPLTHSNLPALKVLDMVVPEAVTYASQDGVIIPALLYKPIHPNGAAIVHPHGGPRDQYIYDWDIFAQYLVAKGYTYLAVNYRGGTGYGRDFERLNDFSWGIGDTQDCLFGARYLANLPWVDPTRIAIFGGSYGGYMVACSLTNDPDHLFRCGVCVYGDTDLYTSWAQCERSTRLYTEMQLGNPASHWKVYQDGSPIYHVEQVSAPVLILHGLEDDVVPPQASEEWVEALLKANKTFEYKTYSGESHGFLSRRVIEDVYQRIERFLDWYLVPPKPVET